MASADYKQRVKDNFKQRSEKYDVKNTTHPSLSAQLLERAGLQAGQHVLDAACGTGMVSLAAARLVGSSGAHAAVKSAQHVAHAMQYLLSYSTPVNLVPVRRQSACGSHMMFHIHGPQVAYLACLQASPSRVLCRATCSSCYVGFCTCHSGQIPILQKMCAL